MRDIGLRSLLPLCSLKSKRFAEKCFDAVCRDRSPFDVEEGEVQNMEDRTQRRVLPRAGILDKADDL